MTPPDRRVAAAARRYRRLLWLYPRAFRERFGDDLTDLFVDLYRQSVASPRSGRAGFWLRIAVDAVRHGVRERFAHQRYRPRAARRRGFPQRVIREDNRHGSSPSSTRCCCGRCRFPRPNG
jgi:hypothetical protein